MRGLSNLFKSHDAPRPAVRPVGPGEIEPAIRLLLGGAGHPVDAAAAAEFEAAANRREIDLLRIHVALVNDDMIAAALPVDSGGSAVLLVNSAAGGSRLLAIASAQCTRACVDAWTAPTPLFQILIDPAEWRTAEEMRHRGFEDLASLIYLQRTLGRPMPRPPVPPGLTLLTDSPENRPLFKQAILASYEQSLDCPKLHGRRSIDEVIAAHQSTGEHDPALWFCLTENNAPIGVLLLSRLSDERGLELVYLGLAPAGRGRGFGDLFLQLALAETSRTGGRQMTLAVDDHNAPALQLYYRHGLSQVHTRLAMMCTKPATSVTAI